MLKLILIISIFLLGCTTEVISAEPPEQDDNNMTQPFDLGWSQSGSCQAGESGRAVTLQVEFPIPNFYTIQFGVVNQDNNHINPEALITWAVKGNTVSRRVSVGNGTSISGTGEAVHVRVSDARLPFGGGGPEYVVSILVTPGSRPSKEQPPILREGDEVTVLAAGAGADFDVPADAGVISVDVEASFPGGTTVSPVDIRVRELDVSGAVVLKEYNPFLQQDFVPIVPGTGMIRVTNQHASATANITVIWGIDG